MFLGAGILTQKPTEHLFPPHPTTTYRALVGCALMTRCRGVVTVLLKYLSRTVVRLRTATVQKQRRVIPSFSSVNKRGGRLLSTSLALIFVRALHNPSKQFLGKND